MWFDDGQWITFDVPQGLSKWKIIEKTYERAMISSEWATKERDALSQARAIFTCVNDQHHVALLKLRMQIPFRDSALKSRQERAKQAQSDMLFDAECEVDALQTLTQAGCSSSPKLLAWKHELQGESDWVPGGVMDYILMEKLPGTTPPFYLNPDVTEQEWNELRAAFKEAYIECYLCGRMTLDAGPRNILWDRKAKKCYIVDWEGAHHSCPEFKWREAQYFFWGLKDAESCKAAERMEGSEAVHRNKENAR
ncbi:hypothetical protein ATEIFO6365_0016009100 [Aspergillus terreus]|uniref:Uncharacterized protein n=1 Tax=Aspergillus terreus TaxID=33178 RepID=A0A5M3ZDV6_ASPTE|nr:hypothetical protein ATETN484_0017009600 [Aspergillus terreus]GFF21767.1 hypothetical protein ATEIFO6365_0016009100 [Aspergillus terreus]